MHLEDAFLDMRKLKRQYSQYIGRIWYQIQVFSELVETKRIQKVTQSKVQGTGPNYILVSDFIPGLLCRSALKY